MCLTQTISDPTHTSGHALDLVIVRDDSNLVDSSSVHVRDLLLSDHLGVFFLSLRPENLVKQFWLQRTSHIDPASFNVAIKQSLREAMVSSCDAASVELLDTYNKALTCILDAQASIKV